jgi:predicted cobalt transporter CbtA
MVRALLVRGMLVGIVAGLFSFGFLKIYGEPQLALAISFETQQDLARHSHAPSSATGVTEEHHEALVSRQVQAGLGLFVAVVVYGAAIGGLFGLAFAFAYGRVGATLTPRAVAALLAAAAFVAVYLVPSLKYPASPPAVGDAETIGARTALYFLMIAISIAAMIGAVAFKRLLVPRFGEWNATLIVIGYYIVIVALAGLILPAVNEVPTEFPADVLWRFRIASIGAQLIMWTTLGALFGALTQRSLTAGTAARPSRA